MPRFEPTTFRPTSSSWSCQLPFLTVVLASFGCQHCWALFRSKFLWGTKQRSPASNLSLNPGFPRVCASRESRCARLHLQPRTVEASWVELFVQRNVIMDSDDFPSINTTVNQFISRRVCCQPCNVAQLQFNFKATQKIKCYHPIIFFVVRACHLPVLDGSINIFKPLSASLYTASWINFSNMS